MIRPPKRAVTRFFIPLIDVLILLFCIFLLMPFVSSAPQTPDVLPANVEELQQQLAMANRRIAELKNDRASLFERFRVQVLEIDRDTGKLFGFSESGRQEVKNQSDANRLIERAKSRAGAKEICFLLIYPRELSGFPLREQIETYLRWFRDVPHSFDNPWAASPAAR